MDQVRKNCHTYEVDEMRSHAKSGLKSSERRRVPPPRLSYWRIHQEETHSRLRDGVSHRARIERDRHGQMIEIERPVDATSTRCEYHQYHMTCNKNTTARQVVIFHTRYASGFSSIGRCRSVGTLRTTKALRARAVIVLCAGTSTYTMCHAFLSSVSHL